MREMREGMGASRSGRAAGLLLAVLAALAMVLTVGVVGVRPAQAAGTTLGEGKYWTSLPNGIAPGKYRMNQTRQNPQFADVTVFNANGDRLKSYVSYGPNDTEIVDVPAGSYVKIETWNNNSTTWTQLSAYRNYGLYQVGRAFTKVEGKYWSNLSDGIAPGRYQVNQTRQNPQFADVTVYKANGDRLKSYVSYGPNDTEIVDVPAGGHVKIETWNNNSTTWRRLSKRPAYLRVKDVSSRTPHASEVSRLIRSGISTGWEESDGSVTFRPMNTVVRQDMAAFLYRMAGSPGFTPTAADRARFWDVSDQTPHAREIWWLARAGIAKGYPDGSFGGYRTVVRQDMAAFLHRYAAKYGTRAKVGAARSFRDVDSHTSHASDIWWLARTGVAKGYPDGTFGGMRDVVRQDMAAFLIRIKK